MSKLLQDSLLVVDDILFIIEMTLKLKKDEKFGRQGFYTQKFLFELLNFYKRHNKDVLCLPFNTLVRFEGASSRNISGILSFCLKRGILTIAQPANPENHISTIYKLNYQFKRGQPVESLCDGLSLIFNSEQLQKQYTDFIYRNYIAKHNELATL
jgi:hypothetical protein